VQPTTAIWNSMLGAYAKSGSVDGAYATWVNMLESGESR
jgi:pentatricopeptide repeat protein